MNAIKNNSSSPFKLVRSIVSQNENGAYESGGYDPNNYNGSSDIINSSVEGLSKIIQASLSSKTKTDVNNINKKESVRQGNRLDRLISKSKDESISDTKRNKIDKRIVNTSNNLKSTDAKINKYEKVYGKDLTSNDFLEKQRKN